MRQKIHQWVEKLKEALAMPLPQDRAHILAAPKDRIEGLVNRQWPKTAKKSAVTILLFPEDGQLFTLLMKRVEDQGVHSGQISFPGGQKEEEDKDLLHTAIREYGEETGIVLGREDYIGPISDLYIPASNFLVQAFVAFIPHLPSFDPDFSEVQELHKIPLLELFDTKSFRDEEVVVRQRKNRTYTIKAPCFMVKELCIWGATAMMICELRMIAEENKLILPQ